MRRTAPLFFVLMLTLRASTAAAYHYITPALLQVSPVGTDPGTIQHPQWGGLRYVLFDSEADLLNNGSTGRQIFFFDLLEGDLAILHPGDGGVVLSQLTTDPLNDSQRPSAGRRALKIAYDARIGGVGPRQVMLFNRKTGLSTQVTNGTADSLNAKVDITEHFLVFESAADFFGTGVGGTQIYRLDMRKIVPGCPFPCAQTGNVGLSQITNKLGNSRNAGNTGGKSVVFESDADLSNVGQTENQIYLFDGKTGVTSLLSHGPGAARNPSASSSSRIVFESDADLTGTGTGGTQLFLYVRNKGTLKQLTTAPNGACTNPALSVLGQHVSFISSDDLLGLGSVGPELYTYDLKKKMLVQLTNAPMSVSSTAYSSGRFMVVVADGDLAGNGSPGAQLFVINTFRLGSQTVPVP